ncbi:tetratricopeptide repeat protein [Paludibaculum fermentans]|uniref:tetratricopeptide repeat protein n=1 Tax=Paludibaculum fermentans TaxID=1473598 RepID=UPI003EB983C2
MNLTKTARWAGLAFLVLLVNSFYLLAFATPGIFYMTNVLVHIGLGTVWAAALLWLAFTSPQYRRMALYAVVGVATGGALSVVGAAREFNWLLWTHIGAGLLGALAIVVESKRRSAQLVFACSAVFCVAALGYQKVFPEHQLKVTNTGYVPVSMEGEGGGPKTPFWPSSSKTNVGGVIPSTFFMDSKFCGECHKDIYQQWQSSMHHFSSFNNKYYSKSIEYMQDISGTRGSKWCAGCHDHAVFFNGRFEKPIKDQIETPEAQNGLGCVSCHSITHVDSTMGNGGFTIEYPKLHDLASSKNPLIHWVDRFLTKVEPEPHRRTFLKPFMKDSAEFCSTCHKVHLDEPVNNYRWMRGFNDYDNWQASGVSGQGARSFYYPDKSKTCSGCHMDLVPSKDPGNRDGMVHNHRFAAANTAVPFVNGDKTQLAAVQGFLQSGFISVDIFAAAPAGEAPQTQMQRRTDAGPQTMTTFAVGEEAEQASSAYMIREVSELAAPLDKTSTKFQPGSTIRMDVVVRTKKIGHFFPGGTVDAFDIWVELEGHDATGKQVFLSGNLQNPKQGNLAPVEPGAHFYKSYMLDGDSNPINKRNAWQARSLLYVRLIPPGAADVAHYRVKIPKDAKGPITFTAKLNYRKFTHYYNQFSYGMKVKPGQDPKLVSIHYDSRQTEQDPAVQVPDIPITVLAKAEVKLQLAQPGEATVWKQEAQKADRERWNDWGIGSLLQGDLKAAEYGFTRVTEAQPEYADGWLNVARALIQEGEIERAKEFLDKAMKADSSLGRIWFFQAMAQKAEGDYDAALKSLEVAAQKYPRDRVVQNQIGRILFLKRDYKGAVEALKRVLDVDPEDLQAHYTLMLACRGLGDTEQAAREEKLFMRFKADESSQALTAKMRQLSPEDNNERQTIHEHESSALSVKKAGVIQ